MEWHPGKSGGTHTSESTSVVDVWWLFFSSRKTCCQLDPRLLAGLVSARLPTTTSMWTLLHCFYYLYLTLYNPFHIIDITAQPASLNFLHHHNRYNSSISLFVLQIRFNSLLLCKGHGDEKEQRILELEQTVRRCSILFLCSWLPNPVCKGATLSKVRTCAWF